MVIKKEREIEKLISIQIVIVFVLLCAVYL